MANITVIESTSLSSKYDKRYIVIDKDTGEVLDDTQGHGYKNVRGAYKNRDKSKDKEKAEKRKHIRQWMKEHRSFVNLIDGLAFEIAKGSWSSDERFDAKFVKKLLKENDLEVDFTPGELLKVWQNRKY